MHVMEIGLWTETAISLEARHYHLPGNVDETNLRNSLTEPDESLSYVFGVGSYLDFQDKPSSRDEQINIKSYTLDQGDKELAAIIVNWGELKEEGDQGVDYTGCALT